MAIPKLSSMGREAQAQLRSFITSGLQGQGLTPEITAQAEQSLLGEIESQKGIALTNLPGRLSRFIPKEDERVRTFAKEEIGREAARQSFDVERTFDLIPEFEKQEALGLGFSSVASEQASVFNLSSNANRQELARARGQLGIAGQSLALSQQSSFGSEFSAGLGSGLGQFAASKGGKSLVESSKQLFSRLFNQSSSFFRQ